MGTISGSPFCAGSSVSVPFTSSGINSDNTYTAQLSDASGSFASPTSLGTLSGNATSGTISGTIPTGTATGTGYRIRVVASSPAKTSTDNATNLTINAKPTASISAFTNVACFNGSTGSITVTASGGTAPYNYSWSPSGGTGATASNLTAQSYTVTVTDNKNCQATASKTLTQPSAALSASTIVTNVACFGGNTGAVSVTPSGGTSPYSYNWGSGVTSQNRSNLVAGTYGVTVTDNNNCSYTIFPISVTQPTSAVSGSTIVTNVSCFGGNTGSIDLTPAGGTPGYTYLWNGGATSQDRSNLAAGTYSVTITDANNCQATVSNISVSQPSAPVSGTTVVTNVSCFGGTSGAINLTPTGGVGGYTFQWAGGVTTEDRTGLSAGTYNVTITDANGCTGTVQVNVTQPSAPVSGTTVVFNVPCFEGTNGTINLTPTGGTGPYTFLWNNGATTEDRTGLSAGSYSVVITDNNGCTGTVPVTVTGPSAPVSGATVVTNVACFGGNTGSIDLTPTGGTSPYTYQWNNGPTTQDRTNLTAGTYTVVITDVNGCTGTVQVTVTQPSSALSGSTVVTNVACFGGNTGSINLTPAGGTAPYTFSWNGGATTEDRSNLSAGNYSVTITDANGCQATISNISVTQPSAPVSGTTVVTNIACFGGNTGAINLTPTGGVGGYTFQWAGGATTEDRTGLTAGTYTVVITDANGCTGTVQVTVAQPSAALSGNTSVTNVTCNGAANGSIDLTPAGGTPGYSYLWNDGATTQDRSGLSGGTYSVTITDANGCQQTLSGITVSEPGALLVNAVSDQTVCAGQMTSAVNFTGNATTYSWTNDNVSIGLTDAGTGAIAAFTAQSSGTAHITVTPQNGACSGTPVSFTITVNAAPAASISYSGSPFPIGAGSAAVTFTGSTGGTYSSTTGLSIDAASGSIDLATSLPGTYTITYSVAPAGGCSAYSTTTSVTLYNPFSATITYAGSPYCDTTRMAMVTLSGTTGGTFSSTPGLVIDPATGMVDLAASTSGTYTVTYGDGNGSTSTQIAVRPSLLMEPVRNQVLCNGAMTNAVTFNTLSGVSVNWTLSGAAIGGPAAGSGTVPAFTALNSAGTPAIGQLTAYPSGGTGCPVKAMVSRITVNPTPVLSTLADQTLCAGSLITPLNFASSVAGTLVSWTNTTPAIGLNPAGSNAIPAFVAQNNTGAPLTATITATPFAAGCYGAATTTTLMVSPAAGSFTYPGSPYCPVGAANPRLLGSTGGTYSAPAGIVFYSTSTGSINLGASTPGTYTVTYTVASSNGCPGTAQTQITIKPQATVNPIRNQLYCNGTMTAPVVFTGTASSYTWTVDNPAIGIGAGSGTQLPSFMTVNAGPGTASAYVKVTPQGNGTSNCLGNPFVFRITVNYCPPVTQSGGTGGTDATARTAASLGAFFEVGPNPARSSTVVRYTGSEQGTFAVQLLTSYGTALGKTATLSGTSTTLDLSGVTPGSYLVRITNTRTGAACVKTLVKL